MKKVVISYFLTCNFILHTASLAITFQTVSFGYWNSPGIWAGGISPSYSNSDTLLIYHPIIIESNISLNTGAYLFIDSSGGICGHHVATVNSGAEIIKYGILELDILAVPGGNVLFYQPGDVILTEYGTISNGGSLTNYGSHVIVGPWFDCRAPEYWFAPVVEPQSESKELAVYYDYTKGELNVMKNKYGLAVVISDAAGRQSEMINMKEGDNRIPLKGFSEGIYFYRIFNADIKAIHGKFIIAN